MATLEEILSQAEVIRTQVEENGNTANLVGSVLKSIITYFQGANEQEVRDRNKAIEDAIVQVVPNESVVGGSLAMSASATGVTFTYNAVTKSGATIPRSFSVPVVTKSLAGVITPAQLEELNSAILSAAKSVINAQNDIASLRQSLEDFQGSKGTPDGIAPLDESGRIPSRYIPNSYDDVLEFDGIIPSAPMIQQQSAVGEGNVVYCEETRCFLFRQGALPQYKYYNNWEESDNFGAPSQNGRIPHSGKVYTDTTTNKTYRWGGTRFVPIGSDLALGYTSSTAYPGDEGHATATAVAGLKTTLSNLEYSLQETDAAVGDLNNSLAGVSHGLSGVGILPFSGVMSSTPGAVLPKTGAWYYQSDGYGFFRFFGDEQFDQTLYNESRSTGESVARGDMIFRHNNQLYRYADGKLMQLGGSAVGNTFNVTHEIPLPAGEYYSDIKAEDQSHNVLVAVLGAKKETLGIVITFAIGPGSWKTYQYVGPNVTEPQFTKIDNWIDLAGMSAGTEPVININELCGDDDYTLSTAVKSLIDTEEKTGVQYRKEGLVITYRRNSDPIVWETKQYQGRLVDMTATNESQWKDFGGGGSDVQATDEIEADSKKAITSGAVHEAFQTKPIVNFEEQPDPDNYVFQGVNEKGEGVGDPIKFPKGGGGGQASGSTLNIYPESQAVWGAFGSRITLRAAIKSVSYDGDTEILGTVRSIAILDALTRLTLWSETVNAPSSTSATDYKFSFDFTGFITSASARDFVIQATDADGNTKTRTITVTAVDVTVECIQTLNYSASTTLEVGGRGKSLPMYRFPNNVSTKQGIKATAEMFYNGAWRELGTAVVTDTYSHNVTIDPTNAFGGGERLSHGSYPIRIQGEDLASGVKGNTVYTAVMCIDAADGTPVVSLRYNDTGDGKVRLYDSVAVDVAAYTPDKTSTPVEVVFDGIVVTTVNCAIGQTYNVSKQIQGYASDGSKTIDILARSGSAQSLSVRLTVEGSAIDAAIKEGALFSFDFSTRSNSEADHTIENNGYVMEVDGANWNSNGFVTVLGETALRIAENVKAEIPYAPFSPSSLETSGMAVQFAFSTNRIKNKDAVLCRCYDPASGAGFYITGNEIFLTVQNGTPRRQGVKFKNGEKVTVAVVVEPGSKHVTYNAGGTGPGTNYSFVKLYVNGEECAAIGYQPGTSALRQSQTILFDSESGDFNLNYIMAYSSYMEWLQAFQNYLVKLSDVNAMVLEYDKNNILDTTGKPSMSLMAAKSIPYYVIVADQTTFDNFDYLMNGGTSTSDKFTCTLYYYNPKHPEVNFKATNVLWRRQGTTSAQRPIKNDRFNFNKKAGNGLMPSVELLNPDDSTELGRKAIEAVKHNKVYVSDTGFFVDVVTVKVDYSDSSNANDCGVCDMMNATFRALGSQYMTPAQRAFTGVQELGGGDRLTGIEMDHSTKNHPVAVFRATQDTLQDAWFHAKGNWKEDKGEQTALGFKDTPGYNLGCLNYGDFVEYFGNKGETLHQTEQRFKSEPELDTAKVYLISQYCGRDYAVYRYKSGAWTRSSGSMKQVAGKWQVTGDVLNPVSGYELLQYAGMDWWQGVATVEDMMAPTEQKSSWVNKLGLAAATYPAWTYYFECMIDDDQLQEDLALGRKVPYDLFNMLRFFDSCDYSKVSGWEKTWRENAYKYMSMESAMAYTGFTDYLAAVDQRAKNMQPMFFLEDGCSVENGVYAGARGMEPLRMYLNKVYDCDTCNGADNDGGRDIDPEVDPNKPTDEAAGYTNPYMGSGSVLFNNIDKCPEVWNGNDNGGTTISLRSVIGRMRGQTAEIGGKTMVPFSPDGALWFFVEQRLQFWPKVVSSYDGERKYIDHTNIANLPYFYALHGLGLTSLPRFIEQRWAIRDGYYQTGDFFTNPLSGRVSAISSASKIYITAAATGYFGIGNDASGQLSEVVFLEAGQGHAFTQFAHDAGALLYIYQPGRMSKIDLSEMSLAYHFDDLSKLELAEEIVLGGDKHTANSALNGFNPIGSLVLGDIPFLRKLEVSRTTVSSIDAKGCPRMEEIRASDTPLTSCTVAQTAPIEVMALPATITELRLVNLPKLTYPGGLSFGEGKSVNLLMVEGCPKIDAASLLTTLLTNAQLRFIRLSGLNVTAASSLLKKLTVNGAVGLDENGEAYEETGRCSGLTGRWLMSDLITEDELSGLQRYFPELEIYNNQFTKVTFSDDVEDSENVSNEENGTGYKYSTDSLYNPYVASGHVARLRDSAPICACRMEGGKMVARRLGMDSLTKYADGSPFDPKDSDSNMIDVMKYIPHYWYKGVNDFARSEKLLFLSTNEEKPLSTATRVERSTVGRTIQERNAMLLSSQQQVGQEPVTASNTTSHVCRTNVEGMKLLRFPGFNASGYATVFTDSYGQIVGTFSFGNSKTDMISGDYLIAEVPQGASEAWMTVPIGFDNVEIIATDSDDRESVVPDWIEHRPELVGVYAASTDGQRFVRSVSGTPTTRGDNTQETNQDWTYDSDGNLTSIAVPGSAMHWTMKDFCNAATVRGKGYQIQDYESWKDVAVAVMAILGTRNVQAVCGNGTNAGFSTGGYDEQNPNGFSVFPSAGGNPAKGNLVWGLQNYMACNSEYVEHVAMNIESWALFKRNKYVERSTDPVDNKWHVYDPQFGTERTVQAVSAGSGYCIGKVRWGDRCDIVCSQVTGDNSKWNLHYGDQYNFSTGKGRVVIRSDNVASANGGLVYASAYNASAHSSTFYGARLAFRGEIELKE